MAEFVTDLDQYDAQVKQDKIIRSQNVSALVNHLVQVADNRV